jgi:hypothetical protein
MRLEVATCPLATPLSLLKTELSIEEHLKNALLKSILLMWTR